MIYLLLTKWTTPSGDKINWEIYNDLEAAKIALERGQKQTREYADQGLFLHAPMLVQHALLKAKEVV